MQVSAKEAFNGPDADRWIEADSLERTQLEAMSCWRPLKEGELRQEGIEVVPCVVIYTRKRCGRFKARLVALGNLQSKEL